MLNTCGYTVSTTSTNSGAGVQLSSYLIHIVQRAEYKSSTYPQLLAQFFQQLIHYFGRRLTAVNQGLFPTIHTTNKNNKKFFLTNLLFIYRKAV